MSDLTLEGVLEEWKKDCVIDEVELDKSSLDTPCLHSKYLDYLYAFKKELRKLIRLKKSIPSSDRRNNPDYGRLEEEIEVTENAIDSCERIIQAISQRQWIIKNTISWRQFTQGVDAL